MSLLPAALMLAPAAHPETSCQQFEEMAGFARSDLSTSVIDAAWPLRSQPATRYQLMPADTCFLSLLAEPVYQCERVIAPEALAHDASEGLLSALSTCLPAWTGAFETGDGSGGDMIQLRTLYLAEPGPGSSLERTRGLGRHEAAGGADFHVFLGPARRQPAAVNVAGDAGEARVIVGSMPHRPSTPCHRLSAARVAQTPLYPHAASGCVGHLHENRRKSG